MLGYCINLGAARGENPLCIRVASRRVFFPAHPSRIHPRAASRQCRKTTCLARDRPRNKPRHLAFIAWHLVEASAGVGGGCAHNGRARLEHGCDTGRLLVRRSQAVTESQVILVQIHNTDSQMLTDDRLSNSADRHTPAPHRSPKTLFFLLTLSLTSATSVVTLPLAWPLASASRGKVFASFHHFPLGSRVQPGLARPEGAMHTGGTPNSSSLPWSACTAPQARLFRTCKSALAIRKSAVLCVVLLQCKAVPIPHPAPAHADFELRCVWPASTDGSRAGWPH